MKENTGADENIIVEGDTFQSQQDFVSEKVGEFECREDRKELFIMIHRISSGRQSS